MRALAITGMVTASWMRVMTSGSDIRATPPWARMSAGTRSRAMTAQAPASSAIFACSSVVTSMITPPLSISARPVLTRNVARSVTPLNIEVALLLQLEGANPVLVELLVAGVDAVGERLDEGHQGRVGANV